MGLSQKPQPKPNLFPLAPNTFRDAICAPDSEDQHLGTDCQDYDPWYRNLRYPREWGYTFTHMHSHMCAHCRHECQKRPQELPSRLQIQGEDLVTSNKEI